MFWLQLFHVALAALVAYYLTGKLKYKKVVETKVRGIDGVWTVLAALGFGTGAVWLLGLGAGWLGYPSGLNWFVGGLAAYALCSFVHEAKKGKASEHTKPA